MDQIALNIDCMEYMKSLPDKAFDLAIVDPPYGDANGQTDWTAKARGRFSGGGLFRKYAIESTGNEGTDKRGKEARHWDVAPPPEYFDELFRVSKNQIIWGGNYFELPPSRCFAVWRKINVPDEGFSLSPVEYAWISLNQKAAIFDAFATGTPKNPRIHPTQKPVALYEWLLTKFAKKGDKILDTHLGSGSSRIAAFNLGFEFVGCEINKTYFDLQEKRFEEHTAQMRWIL